MLLPLLLTLAQAAAPAPQAVTVAQPAAKPKLICVLEDTTGSRLGAKRTCRTQADWDQLRMDFKQDLNLKQRNTTK